MSTAADDVAAPRSAPLFVRALLVLLALAALATVGVMLQSAGWGDAFRSARDAGVTAAFLAWVISPVAATAGAVVLLARRAPLGIPLLVAGAVVVIALTVFALVDFLTSESSTAALVFIFLPGYQWVAVIVTIGAALVVHAVRSRRARARA